MATENTLPAPNYNILFILLPRRRLLTECLSTFGRVVKRLTWTDSGEISHAVLFERRLCDYQNGLASRGGFKVHSGSPYNFALPFENCTGGCLRIVQSDAPVCLAEFQGGAAVAQPDAVAWAAGTQRGGGQRRGERSSDACFEAKAVGWGIDGSGDGKLVDSPGCEGFRLGGGEPDFPGRSFGA